MVTTLPYIYTLDDLLKILSLQAIGDDTFETSHVTTAKGGVFGGQVAAQTVRAAAATVDGDRTLNSFHSYFLRPAFTHLPMTFRVHRERDGRSYSHRRVEAVQEGQVVLTLTASFHVAEEGPHWEATAPDDVWNPDDYPQAQLGQGHPEHSYVFDQRLFPYPLHPELPRNALHAPSTMWIRPKQQLGDDPAEHLAVLSYISDMGSAFVQLEFPGIPFGGAPTLDHSLWVHRPFRLDQWLLLYMEPVMAHGGRGMYQGSIFDINKRRLATFTQELVQRPMSKEQLDQVFERWDAIESRRNRK